MKSLFLGLVSALSFCLPANAAAPKLSGTYLYAWYEFCGSGQNVSTSITTGTMTFDDSAKTVSINALHSSSSHYPFTKESGTGTYSNTATAVTLDSDVFQAFYGQIKNGIAGQVLLTWSGKPTAISCANQAILSHR